MMDCLFVSDNVVYLLHRNEVYLMFVRKRNTSFQLVMKNIISLVF